LIALLGLALPLLLVPSDTTSPACMGMSYFTPASVRGDTHHPVEAVEQGWEGRVMILTLNQGKDQEGRVQLIGPLETEAVRASAIAARVGLTQGTPAGTMVGEVSDTFQCICEPLTYPLITLPELLGSPPQLDPLFSGQNYM